MPGYPLIGAHLSTTKGLAAMVHTAVEIGAACIQMFTASPQQWRDKLYAPADVEAFRAALAETGIGPVASHESYLINLASSDPALLEKSRAAFVQEIARCGVLGLPIVIVHWGSYKGSTLEEGLARLAESLNLLIPPAENAGVQIVLETTAGQGSYLGGEFSQFPRLFEMVTLQERLGVCLDTCHVYAAGYDLTTDEGYARTWAEFDHLIGLDRLRAMHLNDTEKLLASHADRHCNIGKGLLGADTFTRLLHDPRLRDVPKYLETPGGDEGYAADLALLRELAG
ncbi:MAG: Endonuclease 4 [bacterium ADurb.Bin429]|nr:MAG: Endonuclease 4 [bacterium ADurb.Bin429]